MGSRLRCIGAISVVALSLAGCANVPEVNSAERAQPTVRVASIVKSPRELVPRRIELSADAKESRYWIEHARDPNLQRIEAVQGRNMYAVLYELPKWTGVPYTLNVSSTVFGKADAPTVFFPKLLLLNDAFEPVRSSSQRDFRLRSNGEFGALSATKFVNEDNTNEKYLLLVEEERKSVDEQILSQGAAAVATTMVLPWQVKFLEVMWSVVSTSKEEPIRQIRASEEGMVELSVIPYKPRRLSE